MHLPNIDIPAVLGYTTFRKSTTIYSAALPSRRAVTGGRLFALLNVTDTVCRFFVSVQGIVAIDILAVLGYTICR